MNAFIPTLGKVQVSLPISISTVRMSGILGFCSRDCGAWSLGIRWIAAKLEKSGDLSGGESRFRRSPTGHVKTAG
jgi:hypothetical protein